MAALFVSAIGSMLGGFVLASEEWSCRSLSAEDGYRCPTIECELISGTYLGARIDMATGDLLETLCKAAKDNVIHEFAIVGFKSETPNMQKITLNESVCRPRIPLADYLNLIVGSKSEEEPGGLITRTLIDLEDSQVTQISREIRTSKCFWENGL